MRKDILRRVDISIMVCMAFRAGPLSDFSVLDKRVLVSAYVAGLARWVERIHLQEPAAVFGHLILKLTEEFAPCHR